MQDNFGVEILKDALDAYRESTDEHRLFANDTDDLRAYGRKVASYGATGPVIERPSFVTGYPRMLYL